MEYSENRFLLDVHDITSRTTVNIKRGETGRKLVITLKDRGSVYPISEDCHAVFTARKPDGKIIFNDCEISGNEIEYKMTPQTVAVEGAMPCEIRLYGADNLLLVSALFTTLVSPAVFNDGDIIESQNEVSTLTALISEAMTLIDSVNNKLESGEFIPKLSIGTVETLPAGSNATAEITGPKEAPLLNLGIPQGDEGQAEGMIPDAALSLDSTKPVQNKVLAAAFNTKADKVETEAALSDKANAAETAAALNTKADAAETAAALDTKVDKASGKGLSTNDFTDAEKQKLAGIEAGANKFVLADGAVSTAKIASGAVTTSKMANAVVNAEKLADDAKSKGVAVTLAAASWSGKKQTVSVSGVTASNNIIVAASPASRTAWNDAEVYCSAQAAGKLTFECSTTPTAAITANVIILV